MATIPPEIIVDILTFLPPKPLGRFKTVAKSWNSQISSADFIKRHLDQTLKSDANSALLICYDSLSAAEIPATNPTTLRFSALDHPVSRLPDHPTVQHLGSCNGVVCISDRFKTTLFLYNPTTKTHRLIPPPPSRIPSAAHPLLTNYNPNVHKPVDHVVVFGFGYDPNSDDYKLLRVIECYNERVQTCREVRLYSLKNDSWKCIDDEVIYPNLHMDGVHINGVLYFIVEDVNVKRMVKCFDLRTETFSHFEMFEHDKGFDNCNPFMRELGGCLCVMVNYQNLDYSAEFGWKLARTDLWVRKKEQGKKECWAKLFSIPDPGVMGCSLCIRPVVYSKDGRRVLLELDGLKFGWYDWGRNKLEKVKARGLPSRDSAFDTYTLVPSLVPVEKRKEKPRGKPVPKKNTNKKNVDSFLSAGFKLRL